MVTFPQPDFAYSYHLSAQLDALEEYRRNKPGRQIPTKSSDHLLLATWNIANLGLQDRRPKDYRLIAAICGWFDLIAVQEVAENTGGLQQLRACLPSSYRLLFSDRGGNNERLAYVYDATKIELLEMIGEVAIPPGSQRYVRLPGIEQQFRGFDRNPYVAAFSCGSWRLVLTNVHLYFGSESRRSENRRALEAYAVGRWADLERRSSGAYIQEIVALGDFNLPKVTPDDAIFTALTERGLYLPEHSTRIGSSIATDNQYDQIAFFPGAVQDRYTGRSGVFDFDGAIFSYLWRIRGPQDFFSYVRYYISDHRPVWMEFRV